MEIFHIKPLLDAEWSPHFYHRWWNNFVQHCRYVICLHSYGYSVQLVIFMKFTPIVDVVIAATRGMHSAVILLYDACTAISQLNAFQISLAFTNLNLHWPSWHSFSVFSNFWMLTKEFVTVIIETHACHCAKTGMKRLKQEYLVSWIKLN